MNSRRQFSVRQLLIVVALVGGLAALGWYWRQANQRANREDALNELIEGVQTQVLLNDAETIRKAIDRVREQGVVDRAAVAMAELMADESFKNSFVAMMVLHELGPATVAHVLESHDDPAVRGLAAQVLGEFRPDGRQHAESLKSALDDPDEQVQFHAATALAFLDHHYANAALPIILAGLKAADKLQRATAASALAAVDPRLYPRVAPTLLDLLDDEDFHIRARAAAAMGHFGAEAASAVPLLIQMMRDEESFWALGHLVRICGPAESPAVEDCLLAVLASDAEPRVRGHAAQVLGKLAAKLPDPRLSMHVLIAALAEEAKEVRMGAAISLGDIGPAAHLALPALNTALCDDENLVREYSAKAIEKIQSAAAAP